MLFNMMEQAKTETAYVPNRKIRANVTTCAAPDEL